jgi:hypothetical protein
LCFWGSILQCRHYAGGTASIDFHLMIRQIAEPVTGIGGGARVSEGGEVASPGLVPVLSLPVSGGIPASGAVLTPKREWGEVTRKGAFAFARRTPVQSL